MRSSAESLRKARRKFTVDGLYRWLVGCAFLFAVFKAAPDQAWPIGLGYVLLISIFRTLIAIAEFNFERQSFVDDLAERKTRHTIVLAAELGGENGAIDPYFFWPEVDRRVEAERDGPDEKPGALKSTALVIFGMVSLAISDFAGLALVAGLTS